MVNTERNHVRAVLVYNGSVLLMKRNKFGDRFYTFVGGKIEPGESHEEALLREVMEEASLLVRPLRLVWQSTNSQGHYNHFAYLCEYVSGEVGLSEGSEEYQENKIGKNIYEPLWVPIADVVRLTIKPEAAKWELLTNLQQGWPVQPKTLQL